MNTIHTLSSQGRAAAQAANAVADLSEVILPLFRYDKTDAGTVCTVPM